jgi:IS30 family transposase
LDDRILIDKGVEAGDSLAAIAARIGCHRSTVSREVRHGSWRPSNTSQAYLPYRDVRLRNGPLTQLQYRAGQAQHQAATRAARSHGRRRLAGDWMVAHVIDRLRDGWTPAMICGRLRRDYPHDPTKWLCPETIYAWVYDPVNKHRGLAQYLPRGHTKRRKRAGRRVRSDKIAYRRSIDERPAEVEDREQFGHWEADSIIGRRGGAALHTEAERKSRFLIVRKVTGVTSEQAVRAQMSIFSHLPPPARRTITSDNGTEFHQHYKVANALNIDTFFADPYSSWQRGTNENRNGQVRRVLPKRTNFDNLTQVEVDEIVADINNRPMRCLDWATPAEVFAEQLALIQTTTCCTSD